jgi:hypothetical protein
LRSTEGSCGKPPPALSPAPANSHPIRPEGRILGG